MKKYTARTNRIGVVIYYDPDRPKKDPKKEPYFVLDSDGNELVERVTQDRFWGVDVYWDVTNKCDHSIDVKVDFSNLSPSPVFFGGKNGTGYLRNLPRETPRSISGTLNEKATPFLYDYTISVQPSTNAPTWYHLDPQLQIEDTRRQAMKYLIVGVLLGVVLGVGAAYVFSLF